MARLYQAGAEIDGGVPPGGGLTANTTPDGANSGAGTFTKDTSVFRSGLASWKCDSATGNSAANIAAPAPTFVDGNSYFARAYFNAAAAPGTAAVIFAMGAATTGLAVRFRTDGALELLVNNVVQGSPSSSIANSVWHRVELKGTATATGNWTASELLLDGVSVATWTGTLTRANTLTFGWLQAPGANTNINIDDVALNDSTGAANTGYPGSGKVVLLSPISDSAVGTGWTNSAGTGTSLFDCVNNIPPTGIADTTASAGHQIRNATSNANVNYDSNMTTYADAGVGAADTVNAVVPWTATAAPVTTSSKQGTVGVASNPAITNVALSATGTSGAFWAGSAGTTYGSGWKWSPGSFSNAPAVTLGTSPVMRITQVTSSTRIAVVCAMFIYVDYTPASTTRFPRNPAINIADPAFV